MSATPAGASAADCRRALDSLLGAPGETRADVSGIPGSVLGTLGTGAPEVLDQAVRAFADAHGAEALPVLARLGADPAPRALRRAVKRALYRLAQRGVTAPAPPPPRPVVTREPERAARAWLSGIDPSGARAIWILFEGGFGGRMLCSLVVSDTEGVVDVAGGAISKKRLDAELQALEADRKLPWIETDPVRAVGLVVEALRLHADRGSAPPEGFARWRPLFESAAPAEPPALPREVDPALVERSAAVLELPETMGWLLDPAAVQTDAVELLGARESRLVVSEQIKAEREDALLGRVIEREFAPEPRARWARRLGEMALVFDTLGREEHAALARGAAAALADPDRDPRHHPVARALARRALDVASEIALGRVSATDVGGAGTRASRG